MVYYTQNKGRADTPPTNGERERTMIIYRLTTGYYGSAGWEIHEREEFFEDKRDAENRLAEHESKDPTHNYLQWGKVEEIVVNRHLLTEEERRERNQRQDFENAANGRNMYY